MSLGKKIQMRLCPRNCKKRSNFVHLKIIECAMFRKLFLSFLLVCGTSAVAQTRWVDTPFGQLPAKVYYATGKHHVQGVAVDT